jgi:hypothetical protein
MLHVCVYAGALTLVGWTMMLPPTRCQSGLGCTPHYDLKAPLNEWEPGHHFSEQSECEGALNKARHQLDDPEGHRKVQAMRYISDESLRSAGRPK